MILLELTYEAPNAYPKWEPVDARATKAYANLRSPVLKEGAISNRDWKLLEIAATPTKQNREVSSNRDKIAPPPNVKKVGGKPIATKEPGDTSPGRRGRRQSAGRQRHEGGDNFSTYPLDHLSVRPACSFGHNRPALAALSPPVQISYPGMSSENETTTSPNATAQNHSDASNSSSDSGSSGSSVSSGGSGAAGVSGHAGAPSPTGVLSSSGASSLAADHAHAQARAAETSRAPFPVLVVDDSPVARKLVECSLPKSEYAILLAKTGQEAIEKFAEHRPGLIITDWLMPDFSGIELCERIRREFRNHFTYIIVLTGVQEKTAVVRGLKAGADEYLTKPFDPDELLARAGVGRRIIQMHREIEEKNRLLEQLALTDQLTDLPNRRAVEEWAKRQISAAARHEFPFWVIMTDLDKFKTINDTWGHDAGDTVLRKFAEILKSNTRSSDICGRIGGDEFLMIITHSQPEGIQLAIERMRAQVEAQRFEFNGQEVTLTASFGVASFRRGQVPDLERLIVQADVALYSAKRRGRNCVAIPTTEVR